MRVLDKGLKLNRSAPDGEKSFKMGGQGMNAQRASINIFTVALAQVPDINALVYDETGLTGEFDFQLRWQPAQLDAGEFPSIFTAVQEQLGLRLVPVRRPMTVLVIDHIERPSEN